MSVMDKFLNIMKLSEEDDDYDGYDDYYDEPEKPKKASRMSRDREMVEDAPAKKTSKVSAMGGRNSRKIMGNGMEVCVIKPTSVEDAREITETLLNNRTVVLNLEGLDVDIAQRIIDFTSGSTFAINGNLQKISHYIFIVTPASVDISGDFQELLGGAFDVPAF